MSRKHFHINSRSGNILFTIYNATHYDQDLRVLLRKVSFDLDRFECRVHDEEFEEVEPQYRRKNKNQIHFGSANLRQILLFVRFGAGEFLQQSRLET